jgi:hypothetical protein
LSTFFVLTVLPQAGTAASRLEWESAQALGALNTAETTERSTSSAASGVPSPDMTTRVGVALRSSPLMFIENAGQFDEGARFQVWGGPGTMWLAEDTIWITLSEPPDVGAPERFDVERTNVQLADAGHEGEPRRAVNLKLSFPDSNPHPRIEPLDRLTTKVGYFMGSDPDQWRPDVPVWGGVRYVDLYPGVDLVVGAGARAAQGRSPGSPLPWRLEVRDGTDVSTVRLRVDGADVLTVDGGRLRLTTALRDFALELPTTDVALQVKGTTPGGQVTTLSLPRVPSAKGADGARWISNGPAVRGRRSEVAQDTSDLLYSTYLGGSSDDLSTSLTRMGMAVDGSGVAYVAAETWSTDFPTTPGAFDTTHNGDSDAFVAKLDATGSALSYATFLGGGVDDVGVDIAVDGSGAAYVTGETWSADFPTTVGAFDTTHNGGPDAFVVKLNATGSALSYATLLGGSMDDAGWGIALDGSGSAHVTGGTSSPGFPTTPGAFDTTHNGYPDAFVAKLNATGSALSYATFVGGSDGELGWGIALDGSGAPYVTGYTWSAGFPTTAGAFATTCNSCPDDPDAFVLKLNDTGSALAYSTFLGGSGSDLGWAIAVDGGGEAYITGEAWRSPDFPTTPGAFDTTYNGYPDAFVAKLNATGSALVYSTFLGTEGTEWGWGVAVDGTGVACVTGSTNSSEFPTTPGAFDTTHNGGPDAFLVKLNATGSALAYATFLGGSRNDAGVDIIVDGSGDAYTVGATDSSDFPTTSGAFDRSCGTDGNCNHDGSYYRFDAFVAKLAVGAIEPPIRVYLPLLLKSHPLGQSKATRFGQ